MTCPTTARYFGDFDDHSNSEVSIVSKEREGKLFSELGYDSK